MFLNNTPTTRTDTSVKVLWFFFFFNSNNLVVTTMREKNLKPSSL